MHRLAHWVLGILCLAVALFIAWKVVAFGSGYFQELVQTGLKE